VPATPIVDTEGGAVNAGKEFNAEAVLDIGGGSTIDIAKAVAALSPVDKDVRELFMKRKQPQSSLPVIYISTTNGSGT